MPKKEAETLTAVAEEARKQAEYLTQWAREALELPIGFRVKVTISIINENSVDFAIDRRDWVYNQDPTSEDWDTVLGILEDHITRADRRLWPYIRDALKEMRNSGNIGYVWKAGRVNAFFRSKGHPYKVVLLSNNSEEAKHSLFVAKRI